MYIYIDYSGSETEYAALELRKFLGEFTSAIFVQDKSRADRCVILKADPEMEPHAYSIHGDGKTLEIRGGNASSVLCAACDALSEAGILFDPVGYSAPTGFDCDAFFSLCKDVKPKFRLRGIRQHINFPMDISSYSLKEAKEYIRSLARMRFNAITFHSYPGQWHETNPDDPENTAGHFFYGQVHPVPRENRRISSLIENRSVYCIPEAEAVFDDPAKRADYAKYWLNEVMKTAKELYFQD